MMIFQFPPDRRQSGRRVVEYGLHTHKRVPAEPRNQEIPVLLVQFGAGQRSEQDRVNSHIQFFGKFQRPLETIRRILPSPQNDKKRYVDPRILHHLYGSYAVRSLLAGSVECPKVFIVTLPAHPYRKKSALPGCREHPGALTALNRPQIAESVPAAFCTLCQFTEQLGAPANVSAPDIIVSIEPYVAGARLYFIHDLGNRPVPYGIAEEPADRTEGASIRAPAHGEECPETVIAFQLAVDGFRQIQERQPLAAIKLFRLPGLYIPEHIPPDRLCLADHHGIRVQGGLIRKGRWMDSPQDNVYTPLPAGIRKTIRPGDRCGHCTDRHDLRLDVFGSYVPLVSVHLHDISIRKFAQGQRRKVFKNRRHQGHSSRERVPRRDYRKFYRPGLRALGTHFPFPLFDGIKINSLTTQGQGCFPAVNRECCLSTSPDENVTCAVLYQPLPFFPSSIFRRPVYSRFGPGSGT